MTRFLVRLARRVLYTSVVCLVLAHGIARAATFLFAFESDAGQATPYTSVSNGISATFSSPIDPGFFVLPTASPTPLFLTLSGNALFQVSPIDSTLNILFDRDIDYVQLSFGSTEIGQLTLTASDRDLLKVGQSLSSSVFLPGGSNAEGSISFGGTAFRSIALDFSSLDGTATFAIDNVTNAPEPATMFLAGLGTVALGFARKFRLSR